MSKYKIGITEAGDAGGDLSWENKLDNVDAAILITKDITQHFSESENKGSDRQRRICNKVSKAQLFVC